MLKKLLNRIAKWFAGVGTESHYYGSWSSSSNYPTSTSQRDTFCEDLQQSTQQMNSLSGL